MSARNYLSAREKNINNVVDCLPQITQQKFDYRLGQELPPLPANASALVNRNLAFSFHVQQSYIAESLDRAGTPFSDFFSDSETGTPDFRSEESDSSAGSALRRNTEEATKILEEEWQKIERTIYDEEGEKATRPHILEECKQWKLLHPQLRVVGKAIQLPENRAHYRHNEHEEVIAVHYSDYEQFSESEERMSQSSSDVTPQNSPRVSTTEGLFEPRLSREKLLFYPNHDEELDLEDTFSSLLTITPLHIRSPVQRKRQTHSILRSELASSKWMRGSQPDSSVSCGRSSAKSFVSLDPRNYSKLSLSAENGHVMGRVVTARHRDFKRLEPLCTPDPSQHEAFQFTTSLMSQQNFRKVSLPPLLTEDERRKVASIGSAKKQNLKTRKSLSKGYILDPFKNS